MSRRDHVYCCECKSQPCQCVLQGWLFFGGLVIVCLAVYGAYKLVAG